ncbi:hypothetical protein V6Z11_A05G434800 [Gossypium hirsutum]
MEEKRTKTKALRLPIRDGDISDETRRFGCPNSDRRHEVAKRSTGLVQGRAEGVRPRDQARAVRSRHTGANDA